MIDTLALWHKVVTDEDAGGLSSLLAEDVVMISPVVFTPQRGKAITQLYLTAASSVLGNEHFKYVRESLDEQGATLEFETVVDEIYVNGVDMLRWNDEGQITEFKVMVRPLQALNMIHQKMGEMLNQRGTAAGAAKEKS